MDLHIKHDTAAPVANAGGGPAGPVRACDRSCREMPAGEPLP